MLKNLVVVMVKTRFPENIGMVARACVNMGVTELILVAPERWSFEKARPLATAKGEALLQRIRITNTIAEAVADCCDVWGTTARTGGWRRAIATPDTAAIEIAENLTQNNKVALLLGPEDHGLSNEAIEYCTRLLTIPTNPEASSLNVAQATLLVLYECAKAVRKKPATLAGGTPESRRINQTESNLLFTTLRETLLAIDYLKHTNSDYFLMPLRRFLGKTNLRRHEFDMIMGICRQVKRLANTQDKN